MFIREHLTSISGSDTFSCGMSSKIRGEGRKREVIALPLGDVGERRVAVLCPKGSGVMKRWVWLLAVLVGMANTCAFAQQAPIPLPEGSVARLGSINSATWSQDGEYLTVTGIGIELRRSDTLELVRFFSGRTEWVFSVFFFPDGPFLAVGARVSFLGREEPVVEAQPLVPELIRTRFFVGFLQGDR